ncbi:MAG: hypothetical protein JWM21_763 [Acidobacteria bacterium]|nr:hypothetical protein [Acidobacteriota bacterium]
MKSHWQISAGEFFELLRPLALVIAALLSTWVLAGARRWGYRFTTAFAWALGTFFFPFIVLPIYLIARSWTKHSVRTEPPADSMAVDASSRLRFRLILPLSYALLLLLIIGFYFYRDYHTIDAHLARAAQAKVTNNSAKAIQEYRAALKLEDNPHTHKLLGIELADARNWDEALREFRAAESGGEPDESLPFRIALALEVTGQSDSAQAAFRKYLNSSACSATPPDARCDTARDRAPSIKQR